MYAAVIDTIVGAPWSLGVAIADSTLPLPPTDNATADDWIRDYRAVPAPLRERLRVLSRTRLPSTSLHLPRPATYFTGDEIARLSREADTRVRLRVLATGSPSIVALSPIAFADDSTHAFVYAEHYCGSLCGGGAAVWLSRNPDGRWQVRQLVPFWVS